jgi:dATP pyrophosphohydrolase
MASLVVRVVDVYPYRQGAGGVELLVLRRSRGRAYAGDWRIVGGKIEPGEVAWQAGLREVEEETGHRPLGFWAVPSVNRFYEWEHDRVNVIPAFAAELPADPRLDDEHDAWAWLAPDEAAHRLAWPEQRRLAALVAETLARGVPPSLVVPPERWPLPHDSQRG